MKEAYYENETQRAQRNVNKTIIKELRHFYNIEEKNVFKIKEAILDIHGMSGRKLDYVGYKESLEGIESINSVSIDDNSSKGRSSANGLHYEAQLGYKKLSGYNSLYKVMRSLYGKEKAKDLSAKMYSYRYALADSGNIDLPYCWSLNTTPLLYEGRKFGQLHSAPCKHVTTYVANICDSVHGMAAHLAGAIALPTIFIDIAMLSIKENFKIEDFNDKNVYKFFENSMQRLIYSFNHNSRTSQDSPFVNVSIFDKKRLLSLVDESPLDIIFNDKEYDKKEIVDFASKLQDCFTQLFMKGDPLKGGLPYRFPVNTLNIDKKRILDNYDDYNFLNEYVRKNDVLRTNIFISEGNKFASCCFTGDTNVLTRHNGGRPEIKCFSDIWEYKNKSKFKVFHNGNWSDAKIVKYNNNSEKVYEIKTSNNKSIQVTPDHILPTNNGDKMAKDITTDDYLMFNTMASRTYSEVDMKLSYSDGVIVGAYLGDGSTSKIYGHNSVILSINSDKFNKLKKYLDNVTDKLGCIYGYKVYHKKNNNVSVVINGKKMKAFIKEWVYGDYCNEKSLNESVYVQSKDFRKGIIDGMYITDGGNSNRIYTTSEILSLQMEAILTTLGMQSIINKSDRTNEKCIIRGSVYNRNFPLYCVRYYEMNKKRNSNEIFFIKNNSMFFKISSINVKKHTDDVFCFEMANINEPYFTLPNGIITHNCRLINDSDLMQYASQSNSFGAGGSVSLGSSRVLTLNLYRLYLELKSKGIFNKENFIKLVDNAVHDIVLILKAHRELLIQGIKNRRHKYFDIGWINLERLFSTVGILGYWEIVHSNDMDWDLLEETLLTINKRTEVMSNKLKMPINIEQIPAESMSHKLPKIDKLIFGELAEYSLYSNQFIPLWEKGYSIWDRISIDGKFNSLVNGGGIVHIQINSKITPSQIKKVIMFAAKNGCEHIALGGTYGICSNGHTHITSSNNCPECDAPIEEQVTRVVGFFTPVSSWSPSKRNLDFKRREYYSEKEIR